MFTSRGTRAFARVALLTAVTIAVSGPALARKATRSVANSSFDAASLIPMPKFSTPAKKTATEFSGPATFFTIAGALAKRDGAKTNGAVRLASADPTDTLVDTPPASALVPARGEEPFGMHAFRAPEGLLWSKWRRLTREMGEEAKALALCASDTCSKAASAFLAMVDQATAAKGGRAQLERVNRIVNASVTYASDMALHGELDRWTAPLATLQSGRGDCEDYAILKREILIHAGVKPADLRIVLLRDTAVRLDHAVLAARSEGQWFILDNRKGGFFEERDLPHYMPAFALDQTGVKLFAVPFAGRAFEENEPILPGIDTEIPQGSAYSGSTLTPVL